MRHPDLEIRGRPDHPDPETAEMGGGGRAVCQAPQLDLPLLYQKKTCSCGRGAWVGGLGRDWRGHLEYLIISFNHVS